MISNFQKLKDSNSWL